MISLNDWCRNHLSFVYQFVCARWISKKKAKNAQNQSIQNCHIIDFCYLISCTLIGTLTSSLQRRSFNRVLFAIFFSLKSELKTRAFSQKMNPKLGTQIWGQINTRTNHTKNAETNHERSCHPPLKVHMCPDYCCVHCRAPRSPGTI